MPTVEVKLKFEDSDEPIIIRDKELLKKIPLVLKAVALKNSNWENEDVVVDEPLQICFSRESGVFILQTVQKYSDPAEHDEPDDAKNYPEANAKSLEELRDIIELGCFMQCDAFVTCIGIVIAKKLEVLDIESVAAYLGVAVDYAAEPENDDVAWMHPPLENLVPRPA